jgi:hypothetical protein
MSLNSFASKCSRQKSLETAQLFAYFMDRKVNNTLHQNIQFEPCGRQGSSFHPTGLGVMIPLTACSAFCKLFFFGVLQDSKINTYAKMWAYMDQNRQATSHIRRRCSMPFVHYVHFTSQTQCRIRAFYKKTVMCNLPVVAVLD